MTDPSSTPDPVVAELIEQHSAFAVTMLRATLLGIELNKTVTGWTQEDSERSQRVFVEALAEHRAALTGEK